LLVSYLADLLVYCSVDFN